MNSKMIEKTLNKIIEIDNTAIDLKTQIKDVEANHEKELKKLFRKMNFEIMHIARKEANNKYKVIIEEAESIEKKINEEKNIEEEKMKNLIETRREELVAKLFEELFLES
ncbi:MAG: hypothetical protein WBA54_00040 [Acidaminobacteraceae bacterium]